MQKTQRDCLPTEIYNEFLFASKYSLVPTKSNISLIKLIVINSFQDNVCELIDSIFLQLHDSN